MAVFEQSNMYDEITTNVRTKGTVIEDFPIIIELYQDLVLRCMLFAGDIFLVGESRELNWKLSLWAQVLETHDFCISKNKTEYMECKFSNRRTNSNLEVKIGNNTILQITKFNPLFKMMKKYIET